MGRCLFNNLPHAHGSFSLLVTNEITLLVAYSFCLTLFIATLYGIKIYCSIKSINLWDYTNKDILTTVVSIKKLYRNIELATAAVIIPLLIWLSLTPSFINTWRMFFAWGLTLLGFGLEYLWYRSYIKQLNNLINWEQK